MFSMGTPGTRLFISPPLGVHHASISQTLNELIYVLTTMLLSIYQSILFVYIYFAISLEILSTPDSTEYHSSMGGDGEGE